MRQVKNHLEWFDNGQDTRRSLGFSPGISELYWVGVKCSLKRSGFTKHMFPGLAWWSLTRQSSKNIDKHPPPIYDREIVFLLQIWDLNVEGY